MGKDFKGDPPLHLKVAAGLTTGALGICVASPTDLVKVRGGGGEEGGGGRGACEGRAAQGPCKATGKCGLAVLVF